jgi:hypothetical protein
LNIFTQPTSQFRVLDSVPDVIQQVGANTDQHPPNHVADAAAVENTDQAMDAPNADPTAATALAPEGSNINKEPTITGMALTSSSTLAEVPHPGDPIPTPPHASASTGPDLAGPSMLATTSTSHVEPAVMKVFYQKRYQHKAKMEPGVAITAR